MEQPHWSVEAEWIVAAAWGATLAGGSRQVVAAAAAAVARTAKGEHADGGSMAGLEFAEAVGAEVKLREQMCRPALTQQVAAGSLGHPLR